MSLTAGEHSGFWREKKLGWKEARCNNDEASDKDARGGGVGEDQCNSLGQAGGQQPHYWLLRETGDANLLVKYNLPYFASFGNGPKQCCFCAS